MNTERHESLTGEHLLRTLSALANGHRLRIVASLAGRRQYVSELARELDMSRPLLHMHLRRLKAARLVASSVEVSGDGRALKYIEVEPFAVALTPEQVAAAVDALSTTPPDIAEEHA